MYYLMNLVFVLEMLFSGGSVIKNLPANAGDGGSNPQLGSSLGVGNCKPLQYFAWEIPWTAWQSMGS